MTTGVSTGQPPATPAETAIDAPTAAALVPGDEIPGYKEGDDVVSDGFTLAVEHSEGGTFASERTATTTTFDIATGRNLTSWDSTDTMRSGCRMILFRRDDGVSVLLTLDQTTTEASGVVDAVTTFRLRARDAATGKDLWSTRDFVEKDNVVLCGHAEQPSISITADGHYAVAGMTGQGRSTYLVDLITGRVTGHGESLRGATGNWLVRANDIVYNTDVVRIVDPKTSNVAGTISTPSTVYDLWAGNAGVAADGNLLVALTGGVNDPYATPPVTAYALPSGRKAWTIPRSAFTTYPGDRLATTEGVFIAYDLAYGSHDLWAFSDKGKVLWHQKEVDQYCGTTAGHVYVLDNHDFATLDAHTGAQTAVQKDFDDCPKILTNLVVTDTTITLAG